MPTNDGNSINSGGNEDFGQESLLETSEGNDELFQDQEPLLTDEEIIEERKKILGQANKPRKRRPLKPTVVMIKCLEASFKTEPDLRHFCEDYFEEVYRNFKATDEYDDITRILTRYCDAYGETESFWEIIMKERPVHYRSFYPRWKQTLKDYQEWRESRDAMEVLDLAEEYSFEVGFIPQEAPASSRTGEPSHPLTSEDPIVINDWFFNDLSRQERSMVLTVALFEGLNRKYMIPISAEIEEQLAKNDPKDV